MTITEFLLARIQDDQDREYGEWDKQWHTTECGHRAYQAMPCNCEVQARVLAECKAKRAIIEWHQNWPILVDEPPTVSPARSIGIDSVSFSISQRMQWMTYREYVAEFGTQPPTTPILRALAAVYSDHPDYDPAWADQ